MFDIKPVLYWSVTDVDIWETDHSFFFVYSSINSMIQLVDTKKNCQIPFDLSLSSTLDNGLKDKVWVMSVKFCKDGSEVLAGCTQGGLCV